MKKGVADKEIVKKRAIKISIILSVFIILCSTLPFVLTGNKIPPELVIIAIVFIGVIITSLIIGFKFREKIQTPKTQKILGYILIVGSCLVFVLNLIADLLEGKVNTSNFILQTIGIICFLALGIILVRKPRIKA